MDRGCSGGQPAGFLLRNSCPVSLCPWVLDRPPWRPDSEGELTVGRLQPSGPHRQAGLSCPVLGRSGL